MSEKQTTNFCNEKVETTNFGNDKKRTLLTGVIKKHTLVECRVDVAVITLRDFKQPLPLCLVLQLQPVNYPCYSKSLCSTTMLI